MNLDELFEEETLEEPDRLGYEEVPDYEELANGVMSMEDDEAESLLSEYSDDDMAAYLSTIDTKTDNISFNRASFETLNPTPRKQKTGIIYQNKEKRTPGRTDLVIRTKIKLTKSVCNIPSCRFDAARACGYKDWDAVPEKRRGLVKLVLNKHKTDMHSHIQSDLVDEADLPVCYLGGINETI